MARKREPIKTRSFVEIDGELREVKDLPKEVWEPIRRELFCRYLNTMFQGKAHFYYPENSENDPNYKGGTIYDIDGSVLSGG